MQIIVFRNTVQVQLNCLIFQIVKLRQHMFKSSVQALTFSLCMCSIPENRLHHMHHKGKGSNYPRANKPTYNWIFLQQSEHE